MGRITQQTLDQIRDRLPVSAVASKYVHSRGLDANGGLSHPSTRSGPQFLVNDPRVASTASPVDGMGLAIDLVMDLEGLTFPEAVERLAAEAGVEVTREGLAKENSQSQAARKDALDALDCAQRFFQDQLRGHKPAHDYLKERGITGRTARDFGIGWAPPPGRCLLEHLRTRDSR